MTEFIIWYYIQVIGHKIQCSAYNENSIQNRLFYILFCEHEYRVETYKAFIGADNCLNKYIIT